MTIQSLPLKIKLYLQALMHFIYNCKLPQFLFSHTDHEIVLIYKKICIWDYYIM
jgi:hypothetical protein